jgi:hypothetical protein
VLAGTPPPDHHHHEIINNSYATFSYYPISMPVPYHHSMPQHMTMIISGHSRTQFPIGKGPLQNGIAYIYII